MVCAPFRLSLGGRSRVNRNRLYACRGQLEGISVPFLLVAPPNRRSRLRPYLLHELCFEKLGCGPLGLASLWTSRRDQAMIVALRCAAEQHQLRVVEFDGHVRPFAFRVPANPGPSLTRAPDRSDCRGEGFVRSAHRMRTSTHMLLFRPKSSPKNTFFSCADGPIETRKQGSSKNPTLDPSKAQMRTFSCTRLAMSRIRSTMALHTSTSAEPRNYIKSIT
jgi:hypothetical protein